MSPEEDAFVEKTASMLVKAVFRRAELGSLSEEEEAMDLSGVLDVLKGPAIEDFKISIYLLRYQRVRISNRYRARSFEVFAATLFVNNDILTKSIA